MPTITTEQWRPSRCVRARHAGQGTAGTLRMRLHAGRCENGERVRHVLGDGENILLTTDANNLTNRDYTYNPQLYGELISQISFFHHYDALGSTWMLTDASRTEIAAYLYRAFGEQTMTYGSSPNRFTWVGRLGYYPYAHSGRDGGRRPSHSQPDSGDYWVRARVYRPRMGRWVGRDP